MDQGPQGKRGGRVGRRGWALLVAAGLVALGAVALRWRPPEPPAEPTLGGFDARLPQNRINPPEIAACATCHATQHAGWRDSHHALANRPLGAVDRAAFARGQTVVLGERTVRPGLDGRGQPIFRVTTQGQEQVYRVEGVLGVSPLWQYLVPFPGGRWQAMDVAFDPARQEWFDVHDGDWRAPEDWGHWTQRSMTWNVQCAVCHMTGYAKGHDAAGDTYASTWRHMGITCGQCHAGAEAHGQQPGDPQRIPRVERAQALETCAGCHSRREELTASYPPGAPFADHYRPLLVDEPDVYFPDGQVRQENFEYGSFRMSRMSHAGVTCLDCHDPHGGKTILPVDNNALCQQCHQPPGRSGAPPIVPARHTFHPPGTPGSRCVDCHMPITTYMARHPRHDHGFTSPDPALTRLTGTPNACNRCHTGESAAWAEGHVRAWYGPPEARPSHQRAVATDALRRGDPEGLPLAIAALRAEPVGAWRASLVGLLAPWQDDPTVGQLVREALRDGDPLVRAAAARGLVATPETRAALIAAVSDPVRLVRLDATASLLPTGAVPPAALAEYEAYARHVADQPAGAFRLADLLLFQGRATEALAWGDRAVAWDGSSTSWHQLSYLRRRAGDPTGAATALEMASRRDPPNAQVFFELGLLRHEAGDDPAALAALKRSVAIDPAYGRAWSNLALLQIRLGDLAGADETLREAAQRGVPDEDLQRARAALRQGQSARERHDGAAP